MLDKVSTRTKRAEIQQWYNGYTFGNTVIYNPWSIMCCLESEGKLDYYWLDSGGADLIGEVLLSDKIQADLQKLATGKSLIMPISRQIRFQDIDKPVGLYSLLLSSGYLNPKAVDTKNDIYRLSIPNDEVGYIYRTRIIEWVLDKLSTDTSSYYTLTGLLASGKVLDFEESLRELLRHSTSFHQTGIKVSELFYNGFMLGLLSGLSYNTVNVREGILKDCKIYSMLSPSLILRWIKALSDRIACQLAEASKQVSAQVPDIIEMGEIYTFVKKTGSISCMDCLY